MEEVRGKGVVEANFLIRPLATADTPALIDMARGTGAFKPIELQALREVLDDYHDHNAAAGHRAVAFERDGRAAGFVYFAEAAMTDRTWSVWWIVVERAEQARGIGGELLRYVESVARNANGRQLVIETSSQPKYERTRRFYLKHGYRQIAAVPNYYAEGDDMLFFGKRLDEHIST